MEPMKSPFMLMKPKSGLSFSDAVEHTFISMKWMYEYELNHSFHDYERASEDDKMISMWHFSQIRIKSTVFVHD